MSTAEHMPVHPETGEVLEAEQARFIAEDAAFGLVACRAALKEARDEVKRLEQDEARYLATIRATTPVDGTVDAGEATCVVVPGYQGKRSVVRSECDRWAEQLVEAGVAERATGIKYPTVSSLTAARAELAAAGVPVGDLIAQPDPGPPDVKVVRK